MQGENDYGGGPQAQLSDHAVPTLEDSDANEDFATTIEIEASMGEDEISREEGSDKIFGVIHVFHSYYLLVSAAIAHCAAGSRTLKLATTSTPSIRPSH